MNMHITVLSGLQIVFESGVLLLIKGSVQSIEKALKYPSSDIEFQSI